MSEDLQHPAENPDDVPPEPVKENELEKLPCEPICGPLPSFFKVAGVVGVFGFLAFTTSALLTPGMGSTRSAKLEWQRRQEQAAEALQRDQQSQNEAAHPARGTAPDGEVESHDVNGK